MVAKVFPVRSEVGPIRDADEGNGHKGSRNQRRGAARDSPRERQSQFVIAETHSRVMAPNALIPHGSAVVGAPQSIIAALRMQTIVA